MLVFILSIISICLVFLMKSFLGTLLAIIALIIALVQWKKKKVINYIGFALSLLLILYSVFAFLIYAKEVGGTINRAKRQTYMQMERELERGALNSIENQEEECSKSETTCALPPTLKEDLDYASNYNDLKDMLKECDGYIDLKYESLNWTAKAYLKCPKYQTEGYETR